MIMHPATRFKNWLSAAIPCAKRFLIPGERSVLHPLSFHTSIKYRWLLTFRIVSVSLWSAFVVLLVPYLITLLLPILNNHRFQFFLIRNFLPNFSNCSENSSIFARWWGRTSVIWARQSLEGKDTPSTEQNFPSLSQLLHLEVSSWTWVGRHQCHLPDELWQIQGL